jgi:ribose 1,5-bisphosphokinase PhnN
VVGNGSEAIFYDINSNQLIKIRLAHRALIRRLADAGSNPVPATSKADFSEKEDQPFFVYVSHKAAKRFFKNGLLLERR